MKRFRTLYQAAAEIKKEDPQTAISYYILRKWTQEGKLPYKSAGPRILIDMDVLENIIAGQADGVKVEHNGN